VQHPNSARQRCGQSAVNTVGPITWHQIEEITGDRIGTFDASCPFCGPQKAGASAKRKVLRIWKASPNWAGYQCARCNAKGYARDGAGMPDPTLSRSVRLEAAVSDAEYQRRQREKAQWLWRRRRPIERTPAERYLRDVRGIGCPLPLTLAYLAPIKRNHHHAVMAAYGLVEETEPGVIGPPVNVDCVQLTLLKLDGSGKAEVPEPKLTIARPLGRPIVIAPANDSLGMSIAEGIEDALSVHQSTGLGAWAAGSAAMMPTLVASVPEYIEAVTIYAHPDDSGQINAVSLANALHNKDVDVFVEGLLAR
jgi:hypothetical protein